MPLTFVQHVEAIARRIQRRRWMTAACWAFAAVVAAMLGLIALDRLLGVYHIVGRVLLTALLAVAVIAIWRRGRAAARGQTTPLDVALDLERRNPQYGSLLASGLQFSQQEGDDPTGGSLDLRRAVVLRTSLAAEAIDLEAAAPRAPLRRAAVAALAAVITLAVPVAIAPQGFATGVVRLLNPLSDVQWPRRHDLAFDDSPSMLPVGGDFQTTLRDRRGALPKSVEVQYRTRRQGRWHYQSQTYAANANTESVEVRWPNVQESFQFRAVGGDHQSMTWRQVRAAPAPQVESLQVTVAPPAYTGLPPATATPPLRGLAPSQFTLDAKTTLPVKSAQLEAEGHDPVPLVIGADGQSMTTPKTWQPKTTAEWSFTLTTPAGMTATAERRLSIEIISDQPPTVEILDPTEDLVVLPTATINFVVEARDDLAVNTIELAITSDSSSDQPPKLWNGVFRFEKSAALNLTHTLNLSRRAPTVGTTWQVHAHTQDFAGQEAKSLRPIRLRIISRDEFLRRIDALQSRLAAALQRAHAQQQDSRQRVGDWLAEKKRPDADAALVALSRQRVAAASLAAGPDSARRLAAAVVTEFRRNAWPDEEAALAADRVAADLNRLADAQLPSIESQLTAFARDLQRPVAPADATLTAVQSQTLAAVRDRQDEVLATLEALVRDLSQSSEVQQAQRELAELKREQSAVLEETESLARESLQRNAELGTDANRRREQAVAKQRELAAKLASTLGRIRQSAASLSTTKPKDAARLDAAIASAERARVQAEVQAAADQLAAQRFAQAAQSQRRTGEQLDAVLSELAKRGKDPSEVPKNDPERAAALQLAVAQLGRLRTMQIELRQRTKELEIKHARGDVVDEALGDQSAKLAAEQRELADLAATLVKEAALLPPAEDLE